MAYLVRRLLENTNDSFLADQARGASIDALLAPPGSAAATLAG